MERLEENRIRLATYTNLSSMQHNLYGNIKCKLYNLHSSSVGYKPGKSSRRSGWSIVRLSVEVPVGLQETFKLCSSACTKKKPHEFILSFGFSEIVGRLAFGFGEKDYELASLSRKLNGGAWKKRYVLEH